MGIADAVWDVLSKSLSVTRLRTIRYEEVTLPNGLALSGSLGDFAVVYELHVYPRRAHAMGEPMPHCFMPNPRQRETRQCPAHPFLASCLRSVRAQEREPFSGIRTGCTRSKAVLGASHAEPSP